jgi:4-amino-4-deoxy-L-arabinose transferase-like glycosyltransferase
MSWLAALTTELPLDRRRWLAPALAVFACLLAHLVFVALLPPAQRVNESTDFSTFYLPVARAWAEGQGLVIDDALAVRYPPLYPLILGSLLALLTPMGFGDAAVIDILQALCIALTGLALFRLARLIIGERLALATTVAWALYPPFLFLGKQPNSELPFLPLLLLAIDLVWRARAAAVALKPGAWALATAAGAAAGLAALCRPIAFALALPIALAFLLDRSPQRGRRLNVALAFTVTLVATLTPWQLALHQQEGGFTLMSTGGKLGILDGLTYATKVADPPAMPAAALELSRRVHANRVHLRSIGAMGAFLREQPAGEVAALAAIKAARAWYGTDSLRYERVLMALQAPLLLALAWAAAVLWRQGGEDRAFLLMVLALIGYFWGMTVIALSILRYLVPILPLAAIAISLAVQRRWPSASDHPAPAIPS